MRAHNFIDLAGERFGLLHVLDIASEHGPHGEVKWRCACQCGGETTAVGYKLRNGHTTSCGCKRSRRGAAHPNYDPRPLSLKLSERVAVNLASGCHEWQRGKNGHGYGSIRHEGKILLAHRAAWILKHGSIPAGLDCLHRCDNPACCNPDHLFLGTQGDNNADRDRKGRHVPLPGMLHGCARLTDEQIAAIRADNRSYREIADQYGIAESHIGAIARGDGWKHLPGAGRRKRGPAGGRPRVRLTESAVRTIRSDARSQDALAKEFGVSCSLISQVRRRVIWRHIA